MRTKIAPASDNGLQTMAVFEKYVLGAHRFKELPLTAILIDPAYQRQLNQKAVQRIVSTFDHNKFEPVTVNWRNDKSTKHWALDGQHRLAAARILAMETVTTRVLEVDRATEATLFVELNRNRLWLTSVQTFKAELAANSPAALEIQRAVGSRGLTITISTSNRAGYIACVNALKKVYARSGSVGITRTLDTLLLAWDETERKRFSGNLVTAVDSFLADNPRVEAAQLAERLSTVTPNTLLAKASQRWHAWQGLDLPGKFSSGAAIAQEIERVYRKRKTVRT